MLFAVDIRVDPKGMSLDELWDRWEEEAAVFLAAKDAGKVVSLFKVVGHRRVLAIIDAESHDELDRMLMAGLPMARHLEIGEVLPVRAYEDFAADVKRRWE